MPVTTGTRLERLEQLARHVAVEIELERRSLREGRDAPEPRPLGLPRPLGQAEAILSGDADVAAVMAELGVTHRDVRAWARLAGFHVSVRGKLAAEIVEAYRDMTVTASTRGAVPAALSRCRVLHPELAEARRPCRYCRTFYGDTTA